MTSTFITNFNNITYEYYIKLPEPMLEWRLYEKLAGKDRIISHPTIFSQRSNRKLRNHFK